MNTSEEVTSEEGPCQVSLWDFLVILFVGLTAYLVGMSDYCDLKDLICIITGEALFLSFSLVAGLFAYRARKSNKKEDLASPFMLVVFFGFLALLCFHALAEVSVSMAIAIVLTCVFVFFGVKPARTPLKFFFLIFSVSVILSFSSWVSRCHNFENLERDKRIVTELVTSVENGKVVIILPSQLAKDYRYLSEVLTINGTSWKEGAIRWSKGDSVWYEFSLPTIDDSTTISLFFDHPWIDYQTYLPLPVVPLCDDISSVSL